MNYSKKSFSVGAPASDTYRDNWERTFRGTANQAAQETKRTCTFCGQDETKCGKSSCSARAVAVEGGYIAAPHNFEPEKP